MAMCMGNTGTITERSPIFAVFATGRIARLCIDAGAGGTDGCSLERGGATIANYTPIGNYWIMRGDTDLAGRYGLEIVRFYEYHRFRYYARLLKLNQANPLAVDDSWVDNYYKDWNLKALLRLRFAGR